MSTINVFISYSHDSPAHSERVLEFAWALRKHGIAVELDQFHNEEIIDWPRWCNEQCSREHSDFVVCVCTAEYKRRIEGNVPPEKGKGVYWEGALLDDDIYDDKGNRRLIPILLAGEAESSIPRFLRGWTHCRMSEFTLDDAGYEHLLRILTNQAKVEKNVLGTIPTLPTRRAPDNTQRTTRNEMAADISRIVKYAPDDLIGRADETALLNDAWAKAHSQTTPRLHIVTFVAMGGEGKTSLVAKWAAELAANDWPGCDAVFAWSFYSQGTREQVAASSDLFLAEALRFFGDAEMADSPQGAYEKGQRLARLVGERRALLLLDGVEPLQHAPTAPTPGELRDQGLAALLKGLATNSRGLCVVTTRYALPDLRAFVGKTVREEKLWRLSTAAGVALLKSLGVKGSERKTIPPNQPRWNEYEALVEDVQGHALTLTLLGTYLRDAHGGDIRQRNVIPLAEANAEELGGHAFHVMDAYVRWLAGSASDQSTATPTSRRALALWQLMGLFDRPATADCLQALWQAPAIAGLTEPLIGLTTAQRNVALKRLEDARLLTVNRDAAGQLVSLDAHPLVREYFAGRMKGERGTRKEDSSLIVPSSSFRAAHQRLYEHLCTTTKEGNRPTLGNLQPLYQAIHHGCLAGEYEAACSEVLRARIRKGGKIQYSWRVLGAYSSDLSAISCFFNSDWSKLHESISVKTACWLYNAAGVRLRAVGRLLEALPPMLRGAELTTHQLDTVDLSEAASYRDDAAMRWTNLAELSIGLGKIPEAQRYAEEALNLFQHTNSLSYRKIPALAFQALAHLCAGELEEASRLFAIAENQQKASEQPAEWLFGIIGLHRLNALLDPIERAAWQVVVSGEAPIDLIVVEREIEPRIALGIQKAEEANQILHQALYFERRAYVELVKSLRNAEHLKKVVASDVEKAVRQLIAAGHHEHLLRGLLTRAWLRVLTGALTGPDSAQDDLDEAWEIAARGAMKLFQADIHLYRARLFGVRNAECGMRNDAAYPWESVEHDLAEAARLIRECGYHRRDEELADAQRALLGEALP